MGKCKYKFLLPVELRKIKPEYRDSVKDAAESCGDGECKCTTSPIQSIRLTPDRAYPGHYVEDEKVIEGQYLNIFGVPIEDVRLEEAIETSTITVHSGNVENVKTFLQQITTMNGKVKEHELEDQSGDY